MESEDALFWKNNVGDFCAINHYLLEHKITLVKLQFNNDLAFQKMDVGIQIYVQSCFILKNLQIIL